MVQPDRGGPPIQMVAISVAEDSKDKNKFPFLVGVDCEGFVWVYSFAKSGWVGLIMAPVGKPEGQITRPSDSPPEYPGLQPPEPWPNPQTSAGSGIKPKPATIDIDPTD